MASLYRAITFIQMHHVSVMVAKNLYFDVSRSFDELLQEQSSVTERRSSLRARSLECIFQLLYVTTQVPLYHEP